MSQSMVTSVGSNAAVQQALNFYINGLLDISNQRVSKEASAKAKSLMQSNMTGTEKMSLYNEIKEDLLKKEQLFVTFHKNHALGVLNDAANTQATGNKSQDMSLVGKVQRDLFRMYVSDRTTFDQAVSSRADIEKRSIFQKMFGKTPKTFSKPGGATKGGSLKSGSKADTPSTKPTKATDDYLPAKPESGNILMGSAKVPYIGAGALIASGLFAALILALFLAKPKATD
jgi:hypothetical protein